ncbi:MAG: cytochrome c biogenesis protein CcdA [Patescibacteria group bacterium]
MELFFTASLVAAFVAGIAALFAPCCITVLLPSYFASIFREKKKIFLMTFIFFLGILAVFLPLGLGFAALGGIFSRYHNTIFSVGGAFLLILGLAMILGRHFSLPFHINPVLKKYDGFSVFILGVFSGIATTCCAPVLAGVLALSVLPGSVFWGGLYTLSYVLGMVTPLFFISLFLDKIDFTRRFMRLRQPLKYSLAGKDIKVTVFDLISGAVFFAMGIVTIFLAATNRLFAHSSYQVSVNIFMTKLLTSAQAFISSIPEYIWGALILALFVLISMFAVKQFKESKNNK